MVTLTTLRIDLKVNILKEEFCNRNYMTILEAEYNNADSQMLCGLDNVCVRQIVQQAVREIADSSDHYINLDVGLYEFQVYIAQGIYELTTTKRFKVKQNRDLIPIMVSTNSTESPKDYKVNLITYKKIGE